MKIVIAGNSSAYHFVAYTPTHPVFAGCAIEHYFKFIFFNLDFILLEKLFSLLCKPGIMSLTLNKQHLCQVIISPRDL